MVRYFFFDVNLLILVVVDCNAPPNATGIIIESFNNTKFGALITFHCEESNTSMTAVCGSDGEWDPYPIYIDCYSYSTVPNGKYFNIIGLFIYFTTVVQFLCLRQIILQCTI